MADPFFPCSLRVLIDQVVKSAGLAEFAASFMCPRLSWKYRRVLLPLLSAKDTAAILRWGAVARGGPADELEGPVDDMELVDDVELVDAVGLDSDIELVGTVGLVDNVLARRLCLEPRVTPRTTATTTISPTAAPNSVCFLLNRRRMWTRRSRTLSK